MCNDNNITRAACRRAKWRDAYIDSTRETLNKARAFFCQPDYFAAYQNLFIAFNNYYSWISHFESDNKEAIKTAICRLSDTGFYTCQYVEYVHCLSDGIPQELQSCSEPMPGILNMKEYFKGRETPSVVKHIENSNLATPDESQERIRGTLSKVAVEILWTIRNNQFHAIKSSGRSSVRDEEVLKLAYLLLEPIASSLIENNEVWD